MENPIKENRLVCDHTFAQRLLSFVKSVQVVDACSEDERDSMLSYAQKLLTYQCVTVSDKDEQDYLKRVGVYDAMIEPMLITNDGVEIYEHLSNYTLYSCMKLPCKGDELITITVRSKDDINRRNSDRIYFYSAENCKEYIFNNTPNISRADLDKLGLLEVFKEKLIIY